MRFGDAEQLESRGYIKIVGVLGSLLCSGNSLAFVVTFCLTDLIGDCKLENVHVVSPLVMAEWCYQIGDVRPACNTRREQILRIVHSFCRIVVASIKTAGGFNR